MLDLFSTFWGASSPAIGAGGKRRVLSGSGKGDQNQTGGEYSSGSWSKKTTLAGEQHTSKQPPKAPGPSLGDGPAKPLPICTQRALKQNIPTPPLFVPVATGPAPAATHATESKPSFTTEQALERIQALLRPSTPLAREVRAVSEA